MSTPNDRLRHRSIMRMHFNTDGKPKKRLGPKGAEQARQRGQRTYSCPICRGTHAGNNDR